VLLCQMRRDAYPLGSHPARRAAETKKGARRRPARRLAAQGAARRPRARPASASAARRSQGRGCGRPAFEGAI